MKMRFRKKEKGPFPWKAVCLVVPLCLGIARRPSWPCLWAFDFEDKEFLLRLLWKWNTNHTEQRPIFLSFCLCNLQISADVCHSSTHIDKRLHRNAFCELSSVGFCELLGITCQHFCALAWANNLTNYNYMRLLPLHEMNCVMETAAAWVEPRAPDIRYRTVDTDVA